MTYLNRLVLQESLPIVPQKLMFKLAENRIDSRPFFWPMHEQPVFGKMGLFIGENYRIAERLACRGFTFQVV